MKAMKARNREKNVGGGGDGKELEEPRTPEVSFESLLKLTVTKSNAEKKYKQRQQDGQVSQAQHDPRWWSDPRWWTDLVIAMEGDAAAVVIASTVAVFFLVRACFLERLIHGGGAFE